MSCFQHVQLSETLPGFEHIFRYYDRSAARAMAKILPGEYYLTLSANEDIVTTLGSCISVCICDPKAGLGGMNHFMLPGTREQAESSSFSASSANRYGVFAMESLINGILKHGGHRKRLEIKVTGGGRILAGASNVSISNVDFIHDFLELEGLCPLAIDVGGMHPRKVHYDPLSGRLRVKKLAPLQRNDVLQQELQYQQSITTSTSTGSIELF